VLHPKHLDDYSSHVHTAGEATARDLSKDFQDHGRTKGLPDSLINALHVRYDRVSGELRPGVSDPRYHDALMELEHGTLTRPPLSVMGSFNTQYESRAVDLFSNHLVNHMAGSIS
jgi:hypothetical protein